ncbi:CHAT domain-containing protein [Alteromonas lipolytica]|nr:CHAT domain-containing protein [Alteromonas lipolytica]GGF53267.1 hypothetical protein GCM10011338_01770 [Alteromonas lipolytica]
MIRILCLLLVLAFVQGCANVANYQAYENQVLDGRYESLVSDYETNMGLFANPDYRHPKIILEVCRAYLELKRYTTFFDCIDTIDVMVAEKGFSTTMQGAFQLNTEQAKAYTAPLLSKAYLDLGDAKEALRQAQIAIDAVGLLKDLNKSWYDYENFKMDLLHEPLSSGVIAAKLLNDEQQVQVYLTQLEKTVEDVVEANSFLSGQIEDPNPRKAHLNLAKAYFAINDYENALTELKESGEIEFVGMVSSIVFPSVILTKLAFNDKDYLAQGDREFITFPRDYMVAKIAYEMGDTDYAKTQYQTLLSNPILDNFGSLKWALLSDLGKIYISKKNFPVAEEHLFKAIEEIESHRENINTEAGRIGFVGDKQAVYFTLIDALVEQGKYAEAFEYVERAKARALVDMLAEQDRFAEAGSDKILDELKALELASMAVSFRANTNADQRGIKIQALNNDIQQVSDELSSLTSVRPISVAEIQRNLGPRESLLEYYGSADTLFAFVVSQQNVKAVKITADTLNSEIVRFRNSIELNSAEYTHASQQVYDQIIQPVKTLINGDTLTIVPHGNLHYIPFAALSSGNTFLIDDYNLRFLPSASVLQFLDEPSENASDLLALGNPDLGDAQYDLPGAQYETLMIDKGWKDSKILLRQFASEANFKKFAPSFKYLHLASHGEFNSQSPLQSRMLLSPGDGEDGNLTVSELYTLKLNADLVTLSACETALGEIMSGDDVVGLTRGFLYAGTQSIVASLWAVSDEATAYLMGHFYQNLKTMTKVHALRQAIITTKAKYRDPALWSAFQITGAN